MKYLLILLMSDGGVFSVPNTYPTEATCKAAGILYKTTVKIDFGSRENASYICMPKYED